MPGDCLLCGKPCNTTEIISPAIWERIHDKSKNWSGLDRYGQIYENMSWTNGPAGFYMHRDCHISFSSSTHLERAKQRKRKETEASLDQESSTSDGIEEIDAPTPPKCLRSSVGGHLHYKTKCVW